MAIDWNLLPHSRATNSYDLMQDVKRDILAEPRRVWMKNWNLFEADDPIRVRNNEVLPSEVERFPACGAIGCISGWMNLETTSREGYLNIGWDGKQRSLNVLLPGNQNYTLRQDADNLFMGNAPYRWPIEAHGTKAYAQEVAENIDMFCARWADELKAHKLPAR